MINFNIKIPEVIFGIFFRSNEFISISEDSTRFHYSLPDESGELKQAVQSGLKTHSLSSFQSPQIIVKFVNIN